MVVPRRKLANTLYVQAFSSKSNIEEILKIKKTFLTLKAKSIKNIQRIIKGNAKLKPRIHITTKDSFQKQVIVPMSSDNKKDFMKESSLYITNINRALKQTKLEVMVDFICLDTTGITIVTNKVATNLDLQMIENYVKGSKHINCNEVELPRLPQSKSYLKIISISYLQENSESSLNSSVVEEIIKKNYIFNNIVLAFKLRVIKISPKSDMAIIWIDIWDVQSSSKVKGLIDRYFNIGSYIATIRGANINPRVPQYKNYWKWRHTTFSCRI